MTTPTPAPPPSPLYCTDCHTKWAEGVWIPWQSCPYRDCPGRLSPHAPTTNARIRRRETPTFPLLDAAGIETLKPKERKPKGHAR
jgi:hypothetical protein